MIKRFLSSLLLLAMCLLATPLPALAYNSFSGVECGNSSAQRSTVCKEKTNNNPLTGNDGLLVKITNIVAFIAGVAAVIMILVSSVRFITSGSDISTQSRTDTDVESARHTIANALIGLAIVVLARSIIVFVLSRIN